MLERVEAGLRITLVLLAIGLVAAVVCGIALRPPAPVGYAAIEGRVLLLRSGTGPTPASMEAVRFRQHAIGVGVRCDGTGTLRVELSPFGGVESPCLPYDTANGGYVLSSVPVSAIRWQVRTGSHNRWSIVLTQPVHDGGALAP